MNKKISVIIPCYNVEKYIERCMKSIINQTFKIEQLEIIMIDDASSDNTWYKLLEYESQYPDIIKLVHLDKNMKQGTCRNIGISLASADYISFIDSDDWIENVFFEKLCNLIGKYDCDIVSCDYVRDRGEDVNIRAENDSCGERFIQIQNDKDRKNFMIGYDLGTVVWGKLYKASFLKDNQILFPEGFTYEDHFFMGLLHLYARTIVVSSEKLYHYFVNLQSTVLNKNSHHHFDIVEVHELLWNEYIYRGYYDTYKNEISFLYLTQFYLTFMKLLILRFDNSPWDIFFEVRNMINDKINNYNDNPYVSEMTTDSQKLVLDLLKIDCDYHDLIVILEQIKNYVRNGHISI